MNPGKQIRECILESQSNGKTTDAKSSQHWRDRNAEGLEYNQHTYNEDHDIRNVCEYRG